MRIKRENTVAVVIDVQQKLFPFIYENEKLTNNIIRLVNGLKVLGIEILVTEQYSKGLGNTILQIQEALGEFKHIEKMCFSCYGDDEFVKQLKHTGRKNVILCGIESHVCVLQTAIDLLDADFNVALIEDCVSSRNPNDKKIAVERIRQEGAIISTYESILFELCMVSGTDEFKAISKIVK